MSPITKGNWQSFITLPDEKILLAQRRHGFVLFFPIFSIALTTLFVLISTFSLFLNGYIPLALLATSILITLLIGMSLATKTIIDWYFHLYILTTKKLLEFSYSPLSSHECNDILLDKVNCTEIDWHIDGFINEIINMGDLVLTFDRPTHQQEFVIKNIKYCRDLSTFLTQNLIEQRIQEPKQTVWYRNPFIPNKFMFIEGEMQ